MTESSFFLLTLCLEGSKVSRGFASEHCNSIYNMQLLDARCANLYCMDETIVWVVPPADFDSHCDHLQ